MCCSVFIGLGVNILRRETFTVDFNTFPVEFPIDRLLCLMLHALFKAPAIFASAISLLS